MWAPDAGDSRSPAGTHCVRWLDGHPADVEAALLEEQDVIEYRLGVDSFERRDE